MFRNNKHTISVYSSSGSLTASYSYSCCFFYPSNILSPPMKMFTTYYRILMRNYFDLLPPFFFPPQVLFSAHTQINLVLLICRPFCCLFQQDVGVLCARLIKNKKSWFRLSISNFLLTHKFIKLPVPLLFGWVGLLSDREVERQRFL